MISFQPLLSPPDMIRNTIPEFENSSKKRKLEDSHDDHEETSDKRSKPESMKSLFDMELHLETPLPLEWQRCLDIQSGQIHFYNTKTHTRTSNDPKRSFDPPSPGHMSLDLKLNLPCDSSTRKVNTADHQLFNKQSSLSPKKDSLVDKKINSSGGVTRNLSWSVEVEVEEEDQKEQEMVATVCMRCHMLVMLCKSSPACPNCKFMHPPDQGPPKLFKQRLSLLC